MSYDESVVMMKQSKFKTWLRGWISDWFGLFDIAIGIITLTAYYPNTQGWFLGATSSMVPSVATSMVKEEP